MAELDPVYKELAQRAVIPEVAPAGTILVKVDSPGRLYEARPIEEVSGSDEILEIELFTLNEMDVSNKYVDLSYVPLEPTEIELTVKNAPTQFYGDDFKQDNMYQKRITWELLNLDGVLQFGDKLKILYLRGVENG